VARAAARALVELTRAYPAVAVRRRLAQGKAQWVRRLPEPVRRRLELDSPAEQPLRIEIGSGRHPTPGYVHVDFDRRARHLEHVAHAWRLPFPDGAAEELIAVHVLEHVHPARVLETLREWRRVLRPGGTVRIHVPNATAIFRAYETAPASQRWALVHAIYGMERDARVSSPDDLDAERDRPDHKAIYDFRLLADVLRRAGFVDVEDLSAELEDRHTLGWKPVVEHLSLIVRAAA
jgi:predicted SAM-dependent methyltransferase